MNIKIIDQTFDKQTWNKQAIHPLQSWEWGEARSKVGIEVVRIGQFDSKNIINTFQMTLHKLPLGFKIGYLPRTIYLTKAVVDFLYNYGKQNNLLFIKIEPYEKYDSNATMKQFNNVVISPHPLFPEWTILMDLTKTEDELLASMKPKTRYNIRLAQKKGVTIKEMTSEEGFQIFQKLYFETTSRQGYLGHNFDYHKSIFTTLKGTIIHILVAFYKDEPLAAYEVFIFNGVLYYTYGGSSEKERNVMAPNLLMWETVRFGKLNGAKKFDMWNSLAPNYSPDHPWAGFTRFKEGFGGEYVQLAKSMDLVVNPLLYSFYNASYKIRQKLLGIAT